MLGLKHPSVMLSMNDLAGVLDSQRMYEAAEEVYQQVVELGQEVLGPEHPDSLMSMSNFAVMLGRQGNTTLPRRCICRC